MYKNITERVTLNNIANLLQLDTDIISDSEQDYHLTQKNLLFEIEQYLRTRLDDKEVAKIMEIIQNYGTTRDSESFLVGIKVGVKLMNELNQHF